MQEHMDFSAEIGTSFPAETGFPALTSLELLKQSCHKKLKPLNGRKLMINRSKLIKLESENPPRNASTTGKTFSTECIMKLAKARLLQMNSQKTDILSNLAGVFEEHSALLGEKSKDFELALLLQAAAEKVAEQQLVNARTLLSMCQRSASKTGSPLQRLLFYFAEALQQRIDKELGLVLSEELLEWREGKTMDEKLALLSMQPATMASQHELPYCLVTQFAAAESIMEKVSSAKRVHLIDFSIDNGSQWTLFMQSLAIRHECPTELLKITAIGTCKQALEEAGKWLSNFAETIDLPFTFSIVISDFKNLKEDVFEIKADETVAVYLAYRLWTQLAWPSQLENLVGVIKKLRPCVMVVRELEVCTNKPMFLERFNELLFYLSAMFDCHEACMKNHALHRKLTEEVYIWEMIRNVVAAEGAERYMRHERVSFWRAFLKRFGFVEADLSRLSLCQASILLKRSEHLKPCSLAMDGKILIMGWNGSPLESISAWKLRNLSGETLYP